MSKPIKKQMYSIQAEIKTDCFKQIEASSLEEAVQKSKELKINDYIEYADSTEGYDHAIEITGAYKS